MNKNERLAMALGMLRVIERPLLTSGMLTACKQGRPVILIDCGQSLEQKNVTLWHEVVHLLMLAGGWTVHNEAEVESIAKRLAAACPEAIHLALPVARDGTRDEAKGQEPSTRYETMGDMIDRIKPSPAAVQELLRGRGCFTSEENAMTTARLMISNYGDDVLLEKLKLKHEDICKLCKVEKPEPEGEEA